jgi:putative oxidoreductase
MAYGILFLRLVIGLTMAAHGAQKLFGWFEGPGRRGTAGMFGELGFRAPYVTALAAGTAEFAGGLLFAMGLLTPFAALAIAVVMVTAVGSVHWRNGFWSTAGGYEYNLAIWAAAVSVAATGGARFSLDAALGWADNLSGLWWGVGVLGASLLVAALTLALGRRIGQGAATGEPDGPVDIGVTGEDDGEALVDELGRSGIPARLAGSPGRYRVQIESPYEEPRGLLLSLSDPLQAWLAANARPQVLLRIGERRYVVRPRVRGAAR